MCICVVLARVYSPLVPAVFLDRPWINHDPHEEVAEDEIKTTQQIFSNEVLLRGTIEKRLLSPDDGTAVRRWESKRANLPMRSGKKSDLPNQSQSH